jgi:xylan 1,4-beta-xylosidase
MHMPVMKKKVAIKPARPASRRPARSSPNVITVDTEAQTGAIDLSCYSLGQGGLSDAGMLDRHIEQIKALHPQMIRLFVQEYYDIYPDRGVFNWKSLDHDIEAILATGSSPLLSICIKPPVLFPKVEAKTTDPIDYDEWGFIIQQMVKHCNQERNFSIKYWEIGNEGDIGEAGGCPYEFSPENYLIYYTHTAQAILKADPSVHVGGPALAWYQAPLGDALIDYCGRGKAPLHFFSWHMYDNHPENFRAGIKNVRERLDRYPSLKQTETIIDEWNMSLSDPVINPYFQPAFVLETTLGFYQEGLSKSSYYHIRDFFVSSKQFSRFMSAPGTANMCHWWNVAVQYDGLFDQYGRIRPSYQSFKLLSLLRGNQLTVRNSVQQIRVYAVRDKDGWNHIVIWYFPEKPNAKTIKTSVALPANKKGDFTLYHLNADAGVNNMEMLRHDRFDNLKSRPVEITLKPYHIYWLEFLQA